MKITTLSEKAKLAFARAIFASECGGSQSVIYKWSDADGERTGKSGYSCGITQMDINNNPNALLMLRDLGYTTDEAQALRKQDIGVDMAAMNARLAARHDIVDTWDRKQISECLNWPLGLTKGIEWKDEEAFIHIADYHNQFGMSKGGKMDAWVHAQVSPVSAEMIRDFKYTTAYGRAQKDRTPDKDDVARRYQNIVRLMRAD